MKVILFFLSVYAGFVIKTGFYYDWNEPFQYGLVLGGLFMYFIPKIKVEIKRARKRNKK